MAEQEKVHQGWLYTRDGNKFAPITLIDDIFAMNGKKYKDVVDENINNLKATFNTSISAITDVNNTQNNQIKNLQNEDEAIKKEIAEKFANFNTNNDSDKLFIVDKNDNVIAYIDDSGVHSLDFLIGKNNISVSKFIEEDYQSFVTTTASTLSDLTKKLANFGDDENDKFFIVDKDNNVIAYFDADGTKSINFITPEGNLNQVITDLKEEISERENLSRTVGANGVAISQIRKDIQYFNGGDDDTKLFIIDKNNNVIAYFDELGLHSLNLITPNYNVETDLLKIENNIQNIHDKTIPSLRQEWQTADISIKSYVDKKLQHFNGEDSDKLFIIDQNDNVIAYINETGVHSLDFFSSNTSLETVSNQLNKEITDRNNAIAELKKYVNTQDATINKNLGTLQSEDTKIREEFANADKAVTEAFTAADEVVTKAYTQAIEKETEARIAGDQVNATAIGTIQNDIKHFKASDEDKVLYIIDGTSDNNVIAYIDSTGLHSLNLFTKNYNIEAQINALYAEIAKEAKAASDARDSLKQVLDTEDAAIRKAFAYADKVVTEAYTQAIAKETKDRQDADNALNKTIEDNKTALEKAIEDEAAARGQGDQANMTAIITNASQIDNIKKDLENFDLTASDAMYIIDKNNNVLAKFDDSGLTVTNIILGKVGGRNMKTNNIFYGTSETKIYNFT